jgi:hypothetical protein
MRRKYMLKRVIMHQRRFRSLILKIVKGVYERSFGESLSKMNMV